MDDYTKQIREWLNQRYKMGDAVGHWDLAGSCGQGQVIYYAHQPVYGFDGGHCEPGRIVRYAVAYHLLSALEQLEFESVLDVGAAEGFTASIVKSFFDCGVRCADISEVACKRARALFGIDALSMDLHDLAFADESFDVVLCSETLEHLNDPSRALGELLRVARKAVILSVPHEPEETAERNRQGPADHAHIHAFDVHSFDGLRSAGMRIRGHRILSPLLVSFSSEADRCQASAGLESIACDAIRQATEIILPGDAALCRFNAAYHGVLAVIFKSGTPRIDRPGSHLEVGRLLAGETRPLVLETIDIQDLQEGAGSAPPVICCLDECRRDGEVLKIRGWACQDGCSSRFQRISLVLRSDRLVHLIPASTVERPDVAAHFGNPEYRNAGFAGVVADLDVPSGRYELGLFVRSPAGMSCRYTGQMLELSSAVDSASSDFQR